MMSENKYLRIYVSSRVVFPAPDSPMRAVNVPGLTYPETLDNNRRVSVLIRTSQQTFLHVNMSCGACRSFFIASTLPPVIVRFAGILSAPLDSYGPVSSSTTAGPCSMFGFFAKREDKNFASRIWRAFVFNCDEEGSGKENEKGDDDA